MILEGLSEANTNLMELDRKVQKSIVRKGVRAGCKVMLAAARAAAPVRTGILQRNIKIRSGKNRPGSYSLSVGVNKKDFTGKAFYAAFVLFGHRVGSRKLGDKRKLLPERDFLTPAFEATHDQATETASTTIKELIEQEASKV